LYRLGISDQQLRAQWRQAEHEAGLYAVLSQEIIGAFISPAVWPALHQLLLDGPEEAHRNCLRMVDVEAQRHVPPNKRRPQGGTLSNATLIGMDAELRRLMTIAMFLRQNGHRGALFVPWTWVARQPLIRPGVRQVMRFTPTIPVARAAWAYHRDDLLGFYGASLETLELRVRSTSYRRLTEGGFRRLRNFVLLTLFLILGGRRTAVSELRFGDYDPRHQFLDGTFGPAVGLHPGKGQPTELVRWKPLPKGAAMLIEALIAHRETLGSEIDPNWPMFPSRLGEPSRPLGTTSVTRMFSGARTDPVPGDWAYPLIPQNVASLKLRREERVPEDYDGYSPQALRRLADQMTRLSTRKWCEQNPGPATPDDIAEVLLDHRVPKDPYGYAGISSEDGRERYSGIAISCNWAMLATDEGARRVPDVDAIKEALELRSAIEARIDDVRADLTERRQAVQGLLGGASSGRELAVLIKRESVRAEIDALSERLDRLRDHLIQAASAVERLKTDETTWVVVPDDQPPGDRVDLDVLSAEIAGLEVASRRIREWLRPGEVAELLGHSRSAGNSWARGMTLPFPDGDPRNPWERDAIPIDDSWGVRRRRIWITDLKPTYLQTAEMRSNMEAMLRIWPPGWARPD
jgi:hypothetical protein